MKKRDNLHRDLFEDSTMLSYLILYYISDNFFNKKNYLKNKTAAAKVVYSQGLEAKPAARHTSGRRLIVAQGFKLA